MLQEPEQFNIKPGWFEHLCKNVKKDWENFLKNQIEKEEGQADIHEENLKIIKKLKFSMENAPTERFVKVEIPDITISTGLVYEAALWGKYLSSPQQRGYFISDIIVMMLNNAISGFLDKDEDKAAELAVSVFNSGQYGHIAGFPVPLSDQKKRAAVCVLKGDRDALEKAREGRFLPSDICTRCRTADAVCFGLCRECLDMEKECPECGNTYTGHQCLICYDKEKICRECGKTYTGNGYNGSCKECCAQTWDNGFESTSEHAYEIGHRENNRDLNTARNETFENMIRDIMADFDTDKWLCAKCGTVRAEGPYEKSQPPDQDLIADLLSSCPKCGAEGYLKHVVKGRYFH